MASYSCGSSIQVDVLTRVTAQGVITHRIGARSLGLFFTSALSKGSRGPGGGASIPNLNCRSGTIVRMGPSNRTLNGSTIKLSRGFFDGLRSVSPPRSTGLVTRLKSGNAVSL